MSYDAMYDEREDSFRHVTENITLASILAAFPPVTLARMIDREGLEMAVELLADEMWCDVEADLTPHPLDRCQPSKKFFESAEIQFLNEAKPVILECLKEWSE